VTGPLEGVLFDMDGLLVDTEPLWFETERAVMARLGGQWAPPDQQQMLGGSLERTVAYMLSKAAALAPPADGRRAGPADVADWLLSGMTGLMLARGVTVLPGARELLGEVAAAGLPYALVTSSQRQIMDTVLSVTGLEFKVTVCGEDVARTKPDPEPYLRAATLLGVDPARCAALEDSTSGVASAQAAGCAVVMVPSLPPPGQHPPGQHAPGQRQPGSADGAPAWPGPLVVRSLREVSLARLREAAAAHLTAGASAAVCDDEQECRQG
jgi:HAD superfamily hydrolase (TIGR01509 family)